jgi:hypothetical protein
LVMAQNQTWRPVCQNRRYRYEFTQLQPPDFWQRSPNICWGKIASSTNGAGLLSFTLYQHQFKVEQRP